MPQARGCRRESRDSRSGSQSQNPRSHRASRHASPCGGGASNTRGRSRARARRARGGAQTPAFGGAWGMPRLRSCALEVNVTVTLPAETGTLLTTVAEVSTAITGLGTLGALTVSGASTLDGPATMNGNVVIRNALTDTISFGGTITSSSTGTSSGSSSTSSTSRGR